MEQKSLVTGQLVLIGRRPAAFKLPSRIVLSLSDTRLLFCWCSDCERLKADLGLGLFKSDLQDFRVWAAAGATLRYFLCAKQARLPVFLHANFGNTLPKRKILPQFLPSTADA